MELSAQQKIDAGKNMLEHLFWKSVIVPTVQAQIAMKYQHLRTCEMNKVDAVRAELNCLEQLLGMPGLIIEASKADLLVERYRREQAGEAEEDLDKS